MQLKKYFSYLSVLGTLAILSACQFQQSYGLESLLKTKVIPPVNTYAVSIYAEGEFPCPFELWVSEYQKITLDGSVDTTLYKGDWYGQELSFKSNTPECIDKEAIVKIDWHTL